MKLTLWKMIIMLRRDIANLLERTVHQKEKTRERNGVATMIPSETLDRLRSELKTQLDTLKDNLTREMGENEVYLVMFPLVLLCDEMVMSHLPKQQQTSWLLLQSDLFQINYGGDVFYDFVDERLAKPDTPSVVFEVLYYCLASGFVGKFGADNSKLLRYKALVTERIPGAVNPIRKRKRRRDARELQAHADKALIHMASPAPQVAQKSRSSAWYYLASLSLLTLFIGGLLVFSNL